MQKRAIIFDWGGVLMRTVDYGPRYQWDVRLGLPTGSVESIVHGIDAWRQAQLGQLNVEAYWQVVGTELGLAADLLEELRADFYSGDQLDTELVRLVRDMRGRGLLTGLLSNNTLELADVLADLGLSDLFDAVIISAQIGVMKPERAAYCAVLSQLKTTPEQAAFVDDFATNVAGAEVMGMRGFHFTAGIDLRAALEAWLGEAIG